MCRPSEQTVITLLTEVQFVHYVDQSIRLILCHQGVGRHDGHVKHGDLVSLHHAGQEMTIPDSGIDLITVISVQYKT